MINSFIVLGGGTAGLIAALGIKTNNPTHEVTLIESKEIGIIGVGEGSTEHWMQFCTYAHIDIPEMIRETGATYKIGIKFTNWHGDGTSYWHALNDIVGIQDDRSALYQQFMDWIANGEDPEISVWEENRNNLNHSPFVTGLNQFHFDTNKLNKYFHKLCKERGINLIEDEITDVTLDNDGFVDNLIGKNDKYKADFYVDCSGFRRVIMSRLDSEWVDCQEYLPMNSAIAFPTGYEEDIPPYTESTALSSGWAWRIPTQERFGNGYVYSDKFISDEEAFEEVQKHIGYPIEIGKKIKFSAGYLNKPMNKNCICMGLSAMFVEPLEATSIGSTIQQTFIFLTTVPQWNRDSSDYTSELYNSMILPVFSNIIDFVQLHYLTEREDSDFWKFCKNELKLTPFNKKHVELYKTNLPGFQEFNQWFVMFKHLNWLQVMWGLRLFDQESIKKMWDHYPHLHYTKNGPGVRFKPAKWYPHRQCLEWAMQGIEEQSPEDQLTFGEVSSVFDAVNLRTGR